MIELDSEVNEKYRRFQNYFKKHNVVEAKLRLASGTIISYTGQSSASRTLLGVLLRKDKHRYKPKHKKSKQSKRKIGDVMQK